MAHEIGADDAVAFVHDTMARVQSEADHAGMWLPPDCWQPLDVAADRITAGVVGASAVLREPSLCDELLRRAVAAAYVQHALVAGDPWNMAPPWNAALARDGVERRLRHCVPDDDDGLS